MLREDLEVVLRRLHPILGHNVEKMGGSASSLCVLDTELVQVELQDRTHDIHSHKIRKRSYCGLWLMMRDRDCLEARECAAKLFY